MPEDIPKLCTLMRFNGEGRGEVVDISIVSEDHVFGWVNGELHIEGEFLAVKKSECPSSSE